MMKQIKLMSLLVSVLLIISCSLYEENSADKKTPVDYVNPYMGNISHLSLPAFPTVHLPYSMLRVYPERSDYTSDRITGLPVIVTSQRGNSAFSINPISCGTSHFGPIIDYTYDHERISPYRYSVYLDEEKIQVDYAPSHQSGVYNFTFQEEGLNKLIINARNGLLKISGNGIEGWQLMGSHLNKVYLYMETEQLVKNIGTLDKLLPVINYNRTFAERENESIALEFVDKQVALRYGVSFISCEQARKNLKREINTYSVDEIAEIGRHKWNETLSKIEIKGGSDNDKTVFYTSLYRICDRMINVSEDGHYYSAADHSVHRDEGMPFYIDDRIWDTYRTTHPLQILIEPDLEINVINSYIRMAQQTKEGWMSAFPEITGDSHHMNGNHTVAVVWDAYCKGLRGFDLEAAYDACKSALTEKSLLPGTRQPNTELDLFYRDKGYFPALHAGEEEYVKEVHPRQKRQSVAVTLGTCYDDWCLAQMARELGKQDDYEYFLNRSYNYRNLYNKETGFFHPKDKNGNFIQPFDYRWSGGQGAGDYYDENNGWVYRWDVPHNPADLIDLMGSVEKFIQNMDKTFREPLGKSKFEFYAQLPAHTGNVGQFSMANEPSMHIPYFYNYAGQPWKTQKRIRTLLKQWFRNDLMGVPGDEDGGGLTAFVVFSQMGFYPVTPGSPTYNIGSPVFGNIKVKLGNGKVFEIEAINCSEDNKYIQSATLNGKEWNKPWFSHADVQNGGELILVMGDKANTNWGASLDDAPPSAEKITK